MTTEASVWYHTFGCKANQYDSERMRQEVEALGGSTAPSLDAASLVVVNTCTVTNQADAEARRFIRRLRRENPERTVVVAGCSAALRAQEYARLDGVSAVVEGQDPFRVARAVSDSLRLGAPTPHRPIRIEPKRAASAPTLLERRAGATRGWLKVQDGCDRKCSFCATRIARGASRSRPMAEVVAEATLLAESHPELVITGIHIGHYGVDLEPRASLSDLVDRLLDAVPDVRFRLGSVEATEVDDHLLHLMAHSSGRLVPHLHMPLQSGADPVLRAMRRWHTRAMYRDRALEIADRLPVLGLGADIITGFPGETAEDHDATLALVEELPFTYLHVFPFSPRDGTVAVDLPDPVPQRIAGERSRELREIAQRKGGAYRNRRVGTTATVTVEGEGRVGLTEDYLRVSIDPPRRGSESALLRGRLAGTEDHLSIDLSR